MMRTVFATASSLWSAADSLVDDFGCGLRVARTRELLPDALRQRYERTRLGACRVRCDYRRTGIRRFADRRYERPLAQEIHAELCRGFACPAVAEDVALLTAVGANEGAHVFHDPEHGNGSGLEHGQSLARID